MLNRSLRKDMSARSGIAIVDSQSLTGMLTGSGQGLPLEGSMRRRAQQHLHDNRQQRGIPKPRPLPVPPIPPRSGRGKLSSPLISYCARVYVSISTTSVSSAAMPWSTTSPSQGSNSCTNITAMADVVDHCLPGLRLGNLLKVKWYV